MKESNWEKKRPVFAIEIMLSLSLIAQRKRQPQSGGFAKRNASEIRIILGTRLIYNYGFN
jgi:hypothetical protein